VTANRLHQWLAAAHREDGVAATVPLREGEHFIRTWLWRWF